MRRIKDRIRPEWDQHTERITVRFNEVDSMRVVWHGNYVAYCESAREMFLEKRGLGYLAMDELGCMAPVVRMQLEYLAPAKGGDVLEVTCAHIPGGEPKLECFYEIRNQAGVLLCVAESCQVFVDRQGQVFLSAPEPVERLFATIERHRVARQTSASVDGGRP
jgi:acyl-CoA thioester hydrolase